jgi:hypothetical protein
MLRTAGTRVVARTSARPLAVASAKQMCRQFSEAAETTDAVAPALKEVPMPAIRKVRTILMDPPSAKEPK